MSRFGDAEQLKRFLSTCTKGNAAATCAELKISRATFYRTMDWIVTQVTAAQQQGRNSRRESNNDLKSKIAINALAHPLWGCDRHARELLRIPPRNHHTFRSKPCQRFRPKPATRSTRNPTTRSNPKSATHSKANPPCRRVDVEGAGTSAGC